MTSVSVASSLPQIVRTLVSARRHPALVILVFGSLAAIGLGMQLGPDESGTPPLADARAADPAVARLEAYAAALPGRYPQSRAPAETDTEGGKLPDVATMTARLEARLAKQPNDADGWRLLGLAYKHLGNAPAAIKALQHALSLRPDDGELSAALAELRAAGAVSGASAAN